LGDDVERFALDGRPDTVEEQSDGFFPPVVGKFGECEETRELLTHGRLAVHGAVPPSRAMRLWQDRYKD
jgi:hypothetical protein